jgi:hypothetical protein
VALQFGFGKLAFGDVAHRGVDVVLAVGGDPVGGDGHVDFAAVLAPVAGFELFGAAGTTLFWCAVQVSGEARVDVRDASAVSSSRV